MTNFRHNRKRKGYRFFCLVICTFMVVLFGLIPVRLAIASYQAPDPQLILTLGGGTQRERFTAQFATHYPNLDIWVSSGIDQEKARPIFRSAGIPDTRVHLDYRAIDTVTNFTSLVADFKSRNIQHLFLITSDFHMRRATAIAFFVLGSQGITFTPVTIPSNQVPESKPRILRDVSRSVVWILTGHTGASLHPSISQL